MRGTGRTTWILYGGLAVLSVGACDFVEPLTTNPNAVPDATLDQLLAGVAVNAYDKIHWWDAENLWLQQLDGIDRQLVSLLSTFDWESRGARGRAAVSTSAFSRSTKCSSSADSPASTATSRIPRL
jgi:hypothetical protein